MSENKYEPTQLMLDWHEALLNPDLEQTKGKLCRIDNKGNRSFCCLGVLEEVAGNTVEIEEVEGLFEDSFLVARYYGPTAVGDESLPYHILIQNLLGPTRDGHQSNNVYLGVDTYGRYITASEANDEMNWSFKQIADQLKVVYIDGSGNFMDYTIEHETDIVM